MSTLTINLPKGYIYTPSTEDVRNYEQANRNAKSLSKYKNNWFSNQVKIRFNAITLRNKK